MPAFDKSAEFYDAIYSWKDYIGESAKLREIIDLRAPAAATLLDVACGTGHHLELLRDSYSVEGVDIEPSLLDIARRRLPGVPLHMGDMRTFNLGRQFDVITCLFGSIAYMPTPEDLLHALVNMAGHLAPGGVLIVEPFLTPDRFDPLHLARPMIAETDDLSVVRMNGHHVAGTRAVLDMHYLVARPGTVEHLVEEHSVSLFTLDDFGASFAAAGLTADHDPEGLMGRGLWIAGHSG